MAAGSTTKRLTAAQARQLLDVDRTVAATKRALEDAKEARSKLIARLRDRLPTGEEIEAGGIKVKLIAKSTGRSFRLAAYLAKHALSKEMKPFVGYPSTYEVLAVEELEEE